MFSHAVRFSPQYHCCNTKLSMAYRNDCSFIQSIVQMIECSNKHKEGWMSPLCCIKTMSKYPKMVSSAKSAKLCHVCAVRHSSVQLWAGLSCQSWHHLSVASNNYWKQKWSGKKKINEVTHVLYIVVRSMSHLKHWGLCNTYCILPPGGNQDVLDSISEFI